MSEDYDGLVTRLRAAYKFGTGTELLFDAANALEATLADAVSWEGQADMHGKTALEQVARAEKAEKELARLHEYCDQLEQEQRRWRARP